MYFWTSSFWSNFYHFKRKKNYEVSYKKKSDYEKYECILSHISIFKFLKDKIEWRFDVTNSETNVKIIIIVLLKLKKYEWLDWLTTKYTGCLLIPL